MQSVLCKIWYLIPEGWWCFFFIYIMAYIANFSELLDIDLQGVEKSIRCKIKKLTMTVSMFEVVGVFFSRVNVCWEGSICYLYLLDLYKAWILVIRTTFFHQVGIVNVVSVHMHSRMALKLDISASLPMGSYVEESQFLVGSLVDVQCLSLSSRDFLMKTIRTENSSPIGSFDKVASSYGQLLLMQLDSNQGPWVAS